MRGPERACSGRKTAKVAPTSPVSHPQPYTTGMRASALGLLAFGLLTASFAGNTFGLVHHGVYTSFQRDSESLVVGRILQTRADGFFSEGGLTGRRNGPNGAGPRQQYALYRRADNGSGFAPYRSHPGVNGWMAAIGDGLIPPRDGGAIPVLRTVTAALSAGVFAVATALSWRRFGLLAALVLLVGTLCSSWLTQFAPNLWWALWTMYLPIAGAVWCVAQRPSRRTVAAVALVAMSVKVAMTGYEYVTAVLVSGLVPFVYACVSTRSLRQSAGDAAAYMSGLLGAGLVWMAVLIGQNAGQSGSWTTGVSHVLTVLGNRTHGDPASHDAVYQDALSATVWDATRPYLLDFGPFAYRDAVWWSYGTWCVIVAVAGCCALGLARSKPEASASLRGLVGAALCSVLAPLSWFVLFKGHNYIHIHMNAIVWHVPFIPVSLVLVGHTLQVAWQRLRGSQ